MLPGFRTVGDEVNAEGACPAVVAAGDGGGITVVDSAKDFAGTVVVRISRDAS